MSESPPQRQAGPRRGDAERDDDPGTWTRRTPASDAVVVYRRRRALPADTAGGPDTPATGADDRSPRVFRVASAEEAAAPPPVVVPVAADPAAKPRRRRQRADSPRAPGAVRVIVAAPPPPPPRVTAERLHERLAALQRTLDDIARAQALAAAFDVVLPRR